MDQATPEQQADIRRHAQTRTDFVRWLANALRNRAKLAHGCTYSANDAALDREAADELLRLIEA